MSTRLRLHVVAPVHTQTTRAYDRCAFTGNARRFATMMSRRGAKVYLYAGEDNEAECSEVIPIVTKGEQEMAIGIQGPDDIERVAYDAEAPYWRAANLRAAAAIAERCDPTDVLCLTVGEVQQLAADQLCLPTVEYAVGYAGVCREGSTTKVWPSYAWMHTVLGARAGNATSVDGTPGDTVIPHAVDVDELPEGESEGYHLFVGRLIDRKGYRIAQEVCERLGKRLIVAGAGTLSGYGEHRGVVGPEERGQLMSHAEAVWVPTQYVEPFGLVAAEALACGAPVIASDWGSFPELIEQGTDGFRCRTLRQYLAAAIAAEQLDRGAIRKRAIAAFGYEAVGAQYQTYLERTAEP